MAQADPQVPAATRGHMDEADVLKVLKTLKPRAADASQGDVNVLARIISAVWDVLGEIPKAERRQITGDKAALRAALLEIWGARQRTRQSAARGPRARRKSRAPVGMGIAEAGVVEHSRGSGLGKRISVEEGHARLNRYATLRPLEAWAGPIAGAGEIEQVLGIPRSTLSNWRASAAIVGLLRGERKLAYPLEQFMDARPVQGISDVVKVAPDERAAWLWLRQPHAALQGKMPLDVLKEGGREKVARVAERDFV